MKFLTDENVAKSVVSKLRYLGFDVKDIKEERMQGTPDSEIISVASSEDRIVITHDKDFENIALLLKHKHKGVIVLRLRNQNPRNVEKVLGELLNSKIKDKLPGNMVIVTELQITIREMH
ncbi:MAG: DUF5615 family PIN-like protein [Nanoarchaeota archaeon]